MKKRATLYARVSGDDRGKDGRNLAGQIEMCRDHALKQGWRIVAELQEDDRGASGASFELPQLNQVLEMAQAGDFDVLVVRELDRLSRKLAKQLIVEEELRRCGIEVEYVLAEYPDTAEGRLNKHIRATISEYEREKIKERMARGRRQKVKDGHVLIHGRPPYGYRQGERNGKTTLDIYEPEARIVRMIYKWYTSGNGEQDTLSLRGIARKLTEMRIPSYADTEPHGNFIKKREPLTWHRSSVQRILKSETYAGVWHYGKRCYDSNRRHHWNPRDHWLSVEVDAIISRDTWDAAQLRLKRNKATAKRNRKYEYLLSGRVRCGSCKLKMTARTMRYDDKRYGYYYCPAAINKQDYARECHSPGFRVDQVDATVWTWIHSILTQPQDLESGLRRYQQKQDEQNAPFQERLGIVEDLLADNRRKLERLIDLYLGGDFPKEMLTERKTQLETTIASLEKERTNLTGYLEANALSEDEIRDLQALVAKVGQGLEIACADFETRRRIIEALNMQVTLSVEEGEKVVDAHCLLGSRVLSLVSRTTDGGIGHWRGDV